MQYDAHRVLIKMSPKTRQFHELPAQLLIRESQVRFLPGAR